MYTFFDSFHTAVKEFSGGDMAVYGRLMFIINAYAIDGELLDDLSPVEKLFLESIRPTLDRSLKSRETGKKGGRPTVDNSLENDKIKDFVVDNSVEIVDNSVKKLENPSNFEEDEKTERGVKRGVKRGVSTVIGIVNSNSNSLKECIGKVIVNTENPQEKKSIVDNSITTTTTTTSKNKKIIKKFCSEHSLALGAKTAKKLETEQNLEEVLQTHWDYVSAKYFDKKGDEFTKLFVSSFEWDIPNVSLKKTENKLIKAPSTCKFCGAKLTFRDTLNLWECPECQKKTYWEIDPYGKTWNCNREE